MTPWTIQSMEFSRPEYCGELFPSPGYLPNSGIESRYLALQADSLPCEPPGKPKKRGVGSLSLLQHIFLTQELKQGLLHCRQILYHVSHQGSPRILEWIAYPFSGDLPEPGIKQGSPDCGWILYPLSYQGSPEISLNILSLPYISVE